MNEKRTLIVIDMQNDFIYGPLGTDEARAIVPNVKKKIKEYRKRRDRIIFTQDTHFDITYLKQHEGRYLPVKHCIYPSDGWNIVKELDIDYDDVQKLHKGSFGYGAWGCLALNVLPEDSVEIVGVCTDICVVSNALMIRSIYPGLDITVDASCCAGTTPEMHKAALAVMKSCHIDIINE